jgi:CRP-like cAMP-binding protein
MEETRQLLERARRSAEQGRLVAANSRRLIQTSRELQEWTTRVQGRYRGQTGGTLSFNRRSNRLLGLMVEAEFARMAPQLQAIAYAPRQLLHRANRDIDYVYFPISGLLSATITMHSGSAIEVAPIGNEGFAGLMAMSNSVSPHDVTVQVPGHGLRMSADGFREELKRSRALQDVVTSYLAACTTLNAHQIACNGLHHVASRCCRRLLVAQDRLASDVLPLTHDSLALSLGVRRATVTEELGSLEKRGVIHNRRGRIEILNRPKLQSLACECYQADNKAWAHLFGSNGQAGWPLSPGHCVN